MWLTIKLSVLACIKVPFAADHQNWQVGLSMVVASAKWIRVNYQRVVEHGTAALRNGIKTFAQIVELLGVPSLNGDVFFSRIRDTIVRDVVQTIVDS